MTLPPSHAGVIARSSSPVSRRRALVTGVAGFIGSHLAGRLLRDGYDVVGIDNFTDYYPRATKERNLEHLRGRRGFTFVEGDILRYDFGALLADRVEYVFHLAAQAGVRASWGGGFDTYVRNNVEATQRLLEAAKDVPLRKFVYASSSSVYGDAETFPTPEDAPTRPVSPYGVTKLAGEHLCLLYGRNYGVPVVCLRYFTVYGPRQRPDMAFHRFIEAALDRREIVIYGDGEQTRDFTYVDDAVEGTVRAATSEATERSFNIGGGSQVSMNGVLAMLEMLHGAPIRRRYVDAQRGDARNTGADIGAAAAALGYRPETGLRGGLMAQFRSLGGGTTLKNPKELLAAGSVAATD